MDVTRVTSLVKSIEMTLTVDAWQLYALGTKHARLTEIMTL